MKKSFINRKIRKLKKELLQLKPEVKNIHKVVILNSPDSQLDIKKMEQLGKAMKLHSPSFHILTVKEKKGDFYELRGLVTDISDLNLLGNVKNEQIRAFLNKKYDLLIDFTGLKNELQKYFSLQIKAGFRVGYKTDEDLYDLMLEMEESNLKVFIKEMLYYLKIIGLI